MLSETLNVLDCTGAILEGLWFSTVSTEPNKNHEPLGFGSI